jgi:hypothetical protein
MFLMIMFILVVDETHIVVYLKNCSYYIILIKIAGFLTPINSYHGFGVAEISI